MPSHSGDDNVLQVLIKNFDVLALPLVALVYPLYASVKAIETKSLAEDEQWLTYWVLYAIISLFELIFSKLLEWFPIWPFLKLVGICWLVLPQFNGAEHVYRHFIRPFYMNPQRASTNIWYVPQKKLNFFPKRDDDDILTAAEKYMEKHGTDAFERMIVRKDSYERGRRGGGGGSNNYMIFDDDYRFIMAATSLFNASCSFPSIKVIDCKSYVGLRSNATQVRVASLPIATSQRRSLVVRASNGHAKKLGRSDAECEAAVAAGNVPEAPPVPPKPVAPTGTPVIQPLNLSRRPRRNRASPTVRAAFQETDISPANFVYPLFIHEGEEDTPIGAMPGCYRLGWRHGLLLEVAKARAVGVNSIVLFPKVPEALKNPTADEAYNDNGLVPRTIRLLKDKYPDLIIYTDVALDPYSSDGHDGIVREDGVIMNDETVHQLCKQAVSQARAGADVVSPSDMMDGRVGAIRAALDAEGFQNVSIMSYTAKYASSFYGPFREALDSNPRFGDKKTYQMNPANYREALIEAREDEAEGADILLVKPGLPYLDIIRLLRDKSPLPIAAYQVSGEYSMIKAGGALKMIDEEKVMMESLMCLRRAGADIILTYFALQAATYLCNQKR